MIKWKDDANESYSECARFEIEYTLKGWIASDCFTFEDMGPFPDRETAKGWCEMRLAPPEESDLVQPDFVVGGAT